MGRARDDLSRQLEAARATLRTEAAGTVPCGVPTTTDNLFYKY
jgi:hypothetical protein